MTDTVDSAASELLIPDGTTGIVLVMNEIDFDNVDNMVYG